MGGWLTSQDDVEECSHTGSLCHKISQALMVGDDFQMPDAQFPFS
jgi:hypothetical protein